LIIITAHSISSLHTLKQTNKQTNKIRRLIKKATNSSLSLALARLEDFLNYHSFVTGLQCFRNLQMF
jgi:hypothetical protein